MLKYFIKFIIRNILKFFWVFPVNNNKIYFQSFGGKKIACNPFYIYKYMKENFPNYTYVWGVRDYSNIIEPNVKLVKINTINWIIQVLTSKVLITNDDFFPYLPYRNKCIMIDTWHGGGAYKKINKDFEDEKNNYNSYKSLCYMSKHINYFVSSSEKFTNLMAGARYIDKNKFLPIGMPRNDLFFNNEEIRKINISVRKKIGVEENDFIVLFAPTYRGLSKQASYENNLNIDCIREVIKEKFNKKVKILFRGHYLLKNNSKLSNYDFDVSEYNDMQELLCASDLLITDYSSSMWDYSFLYRPCFLFVPDFDKYNNERGFYSNPDSWGFPICKTNEELCNKIKKFNPITYVNAIKKHHDNLGNYENGYATEQIVKIIIEQINNTNS